MDALGKIMSGDVFDYLAVKYPILPENVTLKLGDTFIHDGKVLLAVNVDHLHDCTSCPFTSCREYNFRCPIGIAVTEYKIT